jgi:hypothetical protein
MRLGLSVTKPVAELHEAKPRPPRPVKTHAGSFNSPKRPIAVDNLPAPEPMPEEPPISQGKTFFELQNRDCRWPLGELYEPAVYYCGAPQVAGAHPYCALHMRKSYTPARR